MLEEAAQEPRERHRQDLSRSWTPVARRRRSKSSEQAEMKEPGQPRPEPGVRDGRTDGGGWNDSQYGTTFPARGAPGTEQG